MTQNEPLFVVYIIFSEKLNKFYVGSTGDFEDRFYKHNTSKSGFTSKGKPWTKIKTIDCSSRTEAI